MQLKTFICYFFIEYNLTYTYEQHQKWRPRYHVRVTQKHIVPNKKIETAADFFKVWISVVESEMAANDSVTLTKLAHFYTFKQHILNTFSTIKYIRNI